MMTSIAMAAILSLAVATEPGPTLGDELGETYDRSEGVYFGAVTSLSNGICGPLKRNESIAEFRVRRTLSGRVIHADTTIRVCGAAQLMHGDAYIIPGAFVEDGTFMPDLDGIVFSGGSCGRFYLIEYRGRHDVRGEDGAIYYSVGRLIPDFVDRFSDRFDFNLAELQVGSNEWLCARRLRPVN